MQATCNPCNYRFTQVRAAEQNDSTFQQQDT